MTFTDDDLKRLKASTMEDAEWVMDWDLFQALLARLEAAEAVIDAESHTEMCEDNYLERKGCTCHFQPAIDAWRKVAGK